MVNTVKRLFLKWANEFLKNNSRRKYFLLTLMLTIPCMLYLFPSVYFGDVYHTQEKPCTLHKLNPWDNILTQYLIQPEPIKCSNKCSIMFVDENGYLQYNNSAISHYSLTSLKCVYHMIHRVDGDLKFTLQKGITFEPPIFIYNRIFRVVCKNKMATVYDFVHTNIVWNASQAREDEIGFETDNNLSVIYVGLDSVSRSHALRSLPKSYKYLTESLDAYDFRGYMKVGLNSFPNQIPLLTGEEHYTFHMENIVKSYLDGMPFIWKEPSTKHHVTLHAEDRPDISTMNYLKSGFRKPPVDYYYRPFTLAMDQTEPIIMDHLGKSTWHCYGNKDHFLLQIEFLKKYLTKYTKRLKFAYFWNNQIGHEDFISLGRGDQPLYELLQWLKSNGHLDRSVLIIGSDHGFRLGGASTTYIGRIENNMPFLMVYIPDVLKKKYPWLHRNLKYNTEKLTSAFDVHETMMSVINGNVSDNVSKQVYRSRTSRSLFQKIPEMRTCADAGIPDLYCTCYDSNPISTSHPVVLSLGNYAVQQLNSMLQNYHNVCRKLSLHNVTEARVMYIAEGDGDNAHIERKPGFFQRLLGNTEIDDSGRYVLIVYTKPNYGQLEIMVDYEKQASDGIENKMTMIGEPIRINRYGNQSHCIDDATLRQYCLCFDIIL